MRADEFVSNVVGDACVENPDFEIEYCLDVAFSAYQTAGGYAVTSLGTKH